MFEVSYSGLRVDKEDDFIVSFDGVNVKPGFVDGICTSKTKDWAHIDQTQFKKYGVYECTQGQAVLSNTSASFVASPKSHLAFEDILKEFGIESPSNWNKFKPEQISQV